MYVNIMYSMQLINYACIRGIILYTVRAALTNQLVIQMGRERSKSRRRRIATPTKNRGHLTENIVTARRDLRAKFYSRVRVHCISVAWKQLNNYCMYAHNFLLVVFGATDLVCSKAPTCFPNTAHDLITVYFFWIAPCCEILMQ